MAPKNLVEHLKSKLDAKNDKALASLLGINPGNVSRLKQRTGPLSLQQVSRIVDAAQRTAIRTIVEHYPINRVGNALFDLKQPQRKDLKDALASAIGVYVFYDIQGKALYVGRTQEQTLWAEMNNALKPSRDIGTALQVVQHPNPRNRFVRAYDLKDVPQPSWDWVVLSEMAKYFSAYEVAEAAIANVEAMLIRAFGNSLLNIRYEKIKESAK